MRSDNNVWKSAPHHGSGYIFKNEDPNHIISHIITNKSDLSVRIYPKEAFKAYFKSCVENNGMRFDDCLYKKGEKDYTYGINLLKIDQAITFTNDCLKVNNMPKIPDEIASNIKQSLGGYATYKEKEIPSLASICAYKIVDSQRDYKSWVDLSTSSDKLSDKSRADILNAGVDRLNTNPFHFNGRSL
jgi:hypothetical protein